MAFSSAPAIGGSLPSSVVPPSSSSDNQLLVDNIDKAHSVIKQPAAERHCGGSHEVAGVSNETSSSHVRATEHNSTNVVPSSSFVVAGCHNPLSLEHHEPLNDIVTSSTMSSSNYPPSQRSRPPSTSIGTKATIPASLQKRIVKTKICVHNLKGRCARASKCQFAHSNDELRKPPNLYKTRLCFTFISQKWCPNGETCRFAHGEGELRWTPEFYKTNLCPYWQKDPVNGCAAGATCRWAHGEYELRSRKQWHEDEKGYLHEGMMGATASAAGVDGFDNTSLRVQKTTFGNPVRPDDGSFIPRPFDLISGSRARRGIERVRDAIVSRSFEASSSNAVGQCVQRDGTDQSLLYGTLGSTTNRNVEGVKNVCERSINDGNVGHLLMQGLLQDTVGLLSQQAMQRIAEAAVATGYPHTSADQKSPRSYGLHSTPGDNSMPGLLPLGNEMSSTFQALQRLGCNDKFANPPESLPESSIPATTFPVRSSASVSPTSFLTSSRPQLEGVSSSMVSKNKGEDDNDPLPELLAGSTEGAGKGMGDKSGLSKITLPSVFNSENSEHVRAWPSSLSCRNVSTGQSAEDPFVHCYSRAFSSPYDPYEENNAVSSSGRADTTFTGGKSLARQPHQSQELFEAPTGVFRVDSFRSLASSLAMNTAAAALRVPWCQSATSSNVLGQLGNASMDSFFGGAIGGCGSPSVKLPNAVHELGNTTVEGSPNASVAQLHMAGAVPTDEYSSFFRRENGGAGSVRFYDGSLRTTSPYYSRGDSVGRGILASTSLATRKSPETTSGVLRKSKNDGGVLDYIPLRSDSADSLSSCSPTYRRLPDPLEDAFLKSSSQRHEAVETRSLSSAREVSRGRDIAAYSQPSPGEGLIGSASFSTSFGANGSIMLDGARLSEISDHMSTQHVFCPQRSCPEYLRQGSSSVISSAVDDNNTAPMTGSPLCFSPHTSLYMEEAWAHSKGGDTGSSNVMASEVAVPAAVTNTREHGNQQQHKQLLGYWDPYLSFADTPPSPSNTRIASQP